jgi:uncharacterized membrane protein
VPVFFRAVGIILRSGVISISMFGLFEYAQAQAVPSNLYIVDGLALGGSVHVGSPIYRKYRCQDSAQFRDFTVCRRSARENGAKGTSYRSNTVVHDRNSITAYINEEIKPAFFSNGELNSEIDRLSSKFGQKPRLIEAPKRTDVPNGKMAIWGTLVPTLLSDEDLTVLRSGGRIERGYLADFIGSPTRSAQLNLPVYSFRDGNGYVWIANYDETGRGYLRFFAIDAGRLTSARVDVTTSDAQPSQPVSQSISPMVGNQRSAEAPTQQSAALEQQLDECGESCPDKPELEKARRNLLQELKEASLVAQDADRFAAAIGNEEAIAAYISRCDAISCGYRNEAIVEREFLVRARNNKDKTASEADKYRTARGDTRALKQYVARCEVCAFAREAVQEVNERQSEPQDLFKLEICNRSVGSVYVAFAARPDLNSDLWVTKGWFEFKAGECAVVGSLRKGNFYVTAHNADGRRQWTGKENDVKGEYCTSGKAFTRVMLFDEDECLEGERSTTFAKKRFDEPGSKWTWTLDDLPSP